MIEFTITDAPDQKFATILNNRRVSLRLRYNQLVGRWSFDLSIDDQPVLHGRRIVTGIDLLASFAFNIGVMFAAAIIPGAEPDRNGLANGSVKFYQTTEDEIREAISS